MLNLTHAQFGFMDETLAAGTRTISNSPAPIGESSRARVLDDSGTLLLDRQEARLLRMLDFRIGDLFDDEDDREGDEEGLSGAQLEAPETTETDEESQLLLADQTEDEERTVGSALANGTAGNLVAWTERFDGLKSLL